MHQILITCGLDICTNDLYLKFNYFFCQLKKNIYLEERKNVGQFILGRIYLVRYGAIFIIFCLWVKKTVNV